MKKVVRLTESDLIRLVKRVIKEQSTAPTAPEGQTPEQRDKALRKLLTDNGFTIPQGTGDMVFTKMKGEEEFMIYFSNVESNTISIMVGNPSDATISKFYLQPSGGPNGSYVPRGNKYSYLISAMTKKVAPLEKTEAYVNIMRFINYTK
jgi:hypothetical protein